jgi:possible non-specific serine/threonine protein kinase
VTARISKVLAGRYEVLELIGRGGMAEVYLGRDKRLSRTVAIKLLRSDIAEDPTFQARFRREAQSAAALNHPAIVGVYDFGEEVVTRADGSTQTVPYLVMEYVQGHTVRELLSEGEAVPIDEAGEIVSGVLQALGYSHRNGIVHRDIKPGNIMLTNTGEVKVMDFGIARAIEDSAVTVTQTHAVVGTAQYLSPEQARGEVVDARSDIYSCGCLLYELLTGRPPFKGDSAVAIAYQHVRELPVPPSQIAPDVPESMDRVVMKALAKHREDRYQNADQMRADLQAAIRGLQVNAPATETWQQQATTIIAPTPGVPSAPAATNTGSIPKVKDEQAARQAEEEAAKRKKKQLLIIGLITLVALLALVGALAAAGVFGGTPSKHTTASPTQSAVSVPDLTGKDEAGARSTLEGVGLAFQRGADVSSDTVPEGQVVSYDPGAGTMAAPGTKVEVHFSSGSATVTVPNVSGQTQGDARNALEKAGLTLGDVTTVDAGGVKAGNVVSTDPAAGTKAKRGSTVNLQVASGRLVVPQNLVGMSTDDAKKALTSAGFTVITINQQTTTQQDQNGKVLSVNPAAGTTVDSGAEITLTVGQYSAPPTQSPTASPSPTTGNGNGNGNGNETLIPYPGNPGNNNNH